MKDLMFGSSRGILGPLLEHEKLWDMSISVCWIQSKVFRAILREACQFFDSHTIFLAMYGPVEENGTDLTLFTRNTPGDSSWPYVASPFVSSNRMEATFLKVVASLVPITSDEVLFVSKG